MRKRYWSWVIAAVALTVLAGRARADAALDSLVASERAFAAHASANGMKVAFLTYLAEDAVVFQPTATNGRKAWESRPASTATLLWEPAYAQVSSAGDLGYTTGPWEFHPPADSSGAPAPSERFTYGHFNSIWKKQKGGVWRVVLDLGCGHARSGQSGVGSGQFEAGPTLPRRTMKSGRVDLRKIDQQFSSAMKSMGAADALTLHGAMDLRMNVEGRLPSLGIQAAQARFDSLAGFFEYLPEGTDVASSGDLGYTYGLAARFVSPKATVAADTSVYLNVWRQENNRDWKLALSVINPLRKP